MTLPEAEVSHQSPSGVSVRPVSTRKELTLFITLPRILYEGMDGYVAPLDMEQKDLLHPKRNPIFRHASVQYFLAWHGDRPVGRISAVVDALALEYWQEKIGWFGALDAIPDRNVLSALLEAARNWLRQQGMARMRGPVTLGYHGESGLMIAGQDQPPMIGTPWHPRATHEILETLDLHQSQDLLTYRLALTDDIDERHLVPGALQPGQGKLGNISVSQLSRKQIAAQGETLRSLYNDGWHGTYNFVPLQSYEMAALIKQLKPLLRSEHYVQINRDGIPVAMALVVPNIFDIAGEMNGAPSIVEWVRLGARILGHRFTSARVILLGVAHEVRGTLLGSLMPSLAIAELLRRRASLPYTSVELGWILASNTPMRNLIERLVPTPNKIHRIYEQDITPNAA